MIIAEHDNAEYHLKHLNYYRLSAYWLPFEVYPGTHRFRSGACFTQVLGLYTFDRGGQNMRVPC